MHCLLQNFEKLQYISANLGYSPIHMPIPLAFCEINANTLQSITSLCVMTILFVLLCNITLRLDTFCFLLLFMQNIYKGYSTVCKVLQYFLFSAILIEILCNITSNFDQYTFCFLLCIVTKYLQRLFHCL